jgi:hypothetical protein
MQTKVFISVLFCFVVMVASVYIAYQFGSSGSKISYSNGYADGNKTGYETGYRAGYETGYHTSFGATQNRQNGSSAP